MHMLINIATLQARHMESMDVDSLESGKILLPKPQETRVKDTWSDAQLQDVLLFLEVVRDQDNLP